MPFDFLSVLVVRGGAVCLPTPPSWFSGSFLWSFIFTEHRGRRWDFEDAAMINYSYYYRNVNVFADPFISFSLSKIKREVVDFCYG